MALGLELTLSLKVLSYVWKDYLRFDSLNKTEKLHFCHVQGSGEVWLAAFLIVKIYLDSTSYISYKIVPYVYEKNDCW